MKIIKKYFTCGTKDSPEGLTAHIYSVDEDGKHVGGRFGGYLAKEITEEEYFKIKKDIADAPYGKRGIANGLLSDKGLELRDKAMAEVTQNVDDFILRRKLGVATNDEAKAKIESIANARLRQFKKKVDAGIADADDLDIEFMQELPEVVEAAMKMHKSAKS